jgi:dUTP pyrophosphatase
VSERVTLKVKRARRNGLPTPAYQTTGAACFDLSADLTTLGDFADIEPGQIRWLPVGWCFEIPPGFEMQVRGRSGLAFRENIIVHHFGTIDCDYRGEVMVGLENKSSEPFGVAHGMRIAQAKIAPVPAVSIVVVDALGETERGAAGFGSTGTDVAKALRESEP